MNKITSKILKELSFKTGRYLVPPEFISLLITFNCNFHCPSCSIWKKNPNQELNENSWLKISKKLSKELKKDSFIEINGGEPLTRKKLVILLTKELKKHFLKIGLNSNGSLINKEVLNQLEQSGLDVIKISFYSLNKETHNYLRGHPLAFDSAQKAIELIQKSKINLEVALLITAQNIKEAPELIQHLQTLPNISIIIQPLDEKIESQGSRNWHSNNLITSLWPKEKDVNNFFDFVLQNNQKIKNPKPNLKAIWQYYLNPNQVPNSRCFTGQRNLVIYPNANVSLCFKGETIGNLNEQNLKKILKNAKSTRKKIKKCPKYCRIIGCNYSRGFKELFAKR